MYESALIVLTSDHISDKFALAAHNLRELMEKLPHSVDVRVVAQTESLKSKVNELQDRWLTTLQGTACYCEQSWVGEIDASLSKFLLKVVGFFEWFGKHHPRRRQEIEDTLQGLDDTRRGLPKPLADQNVDRWILIRDFFISVSHHRHETDMIEFIQWIDALELFLLDLMRPRTFADFDMIDSIIQEVESDG